VFFDDRERDFRDGGVIIADSRVGDDDVDVIDGVLCLEGFNGGGWGGFIKIVNFDEDEFGILAFGEVVEGLGGGRGDGAGGGDDGCVRVREIGCDESFSET
jgi:hypothetical protein